VTNDVTLLLNNVTGVTAGDPKQISVRGIRGLYGVAQAKITGTATVKIYGRLSSTFDWVEIATFTQSDAIEVVLFPEMKADVTAGTGTVTAGVIGSL
jgi:hypothetical protein